MMMKKAVSIAFALSLAALAGCSGGASSTDGPTPAPVVQDNTPITQASAVGSWKLHFDWQGTPPANWVTIFGTASSGDLDLGFGSATEKRGVLEASASPFHFAPISSKIDSGNVVWTLSFNGGMTLDFTGNGSGSSVTGTAKLGGDSRQATWRATKVAAPLASLAKLAGDWTIDFQWAGRTPGELLVRCDESGTCTIPAGQPGGPKTDDVGMALLEGGAFTLMFPDAKHVGVAVSENELWGYMTSTGSGTQGVWLATRGKPSVDPGPDHGGCTADVDCGSCERCERTTGRCIARLTC